MESLFYSMLSRMKYIDRWSLMRNTRRESLCEHTLETAFIAHALCIIKNRRLGGNVDPDRAAVVAMFHDTTEILTGDLPTPIKYYSEELRSAYKEIEKTAGGRLCSLLPDDMRGDFTQIFCCDDSEISKIVKAADKISALIKCTDEVNAGNTEFTAAKLSTENAIKELDLPEADIFLAEFMPGFSAPLDNILEQNSDSKR